MIDKDEIRRSLDAATPGPWEVVNLGDAHIAQGYRVENGKHTAHWIADMCCDDEQDEEKIFADAHLIANAPTWLRELLAELDAKDAEIVRLRERSLSAFESLRAEAKVFHQQAIAAELELDKHRNAAELALTGQRAAEQERDVWKNRHEDAKNDRDTFAREMNEWRRRALAEKEREELRQQNAAYRGCLDSIRSRLGWAERSYVTDEIEDLIAAILDRYKDAQGEDGR